jgi:hypothetical protein
LALKVSKKLSDIVVGNQSSEANWCLSARICGERICPRRSEQLDHLATATRIEDGDKKRAIAEPVSPVNISASLQQGSSHVDMELSCSQMEWSEPVCVGSPGIGA